MTPRQQYQRSMEQVRQSNLAVLMHALHHDGAQSRAALTRRTGLNRSTIAALVAELTELGLVSERLPEESIGVGRPSPIVAVDNDIVAVAVAPDLDAIVISLVGLGGTIHRRVRYSCAQPPSPEEAVNVIEVVLESMREDLGSRYRIAGIGVAVPALVDSLEGHVVLAPNLGWKSVDFGEMLEQRLGLPVIVANDAQLSAAAERRFGAGRDVDQMVYLIGSSGGVGGGAFVDGRELRGHRGFSTEFGHIVLQPGGEPCFCGQRGCMERVVRRDRLVQVLGAESLDAEELEHALLASDDPAVIAEITAQVAWLAAGLSVLISAFAPDTIVLGGFLGTLAEVQGDRLQELVAENSFQQLASGVTLVRGELRSRVALIGAAERVFEALLNDPASVVLYPTGRHQAGTIETSAPETA